MIRFNRLRVVPILAVNAALIVQASCAQDTDAPTSVPSSDGATPTAIDAPAIVKRYQSTITPDDLAAYLYVFASDYFEGRETSTRGQKLAAAYLAGQYRKLGAEPYGNTTDRESRAPEAYFQPVPLYSRRLKSATISVREGSRNLAQANYGTDSVTGDAYLILGSMPEREGSVVFAGYGIADDELGYNDLAALEAKGLTIADKWVLFLGDEPLASDSTSLLRTEDGKPSSWTTSANAKLRGLLRGAGLPAGIMLVGDLGPRAQDVGRIANERAARIVEEVGSLALEAEAGGGRPFPPIYLVSSDLADKILEPSGRTTAEVKAAIDRTLRPEVFEVSGVTVRSVIETESALMPSENIVAIIEGVDPELRHEYVVISSHYDHIGVEDGEGDTVNNGADDDGSGTVSILEVAEAFVRAKEDGFGPRRSILFLNVTGEEKGLLGSRYFTDIDPLVPLENVVANLNIDMIGRFDPTHPTGSENYVYIIGSNLISQELHDINVQVNDLTGVALELDERFNSKDDPNQFYRRSDHWNFGKHSIPFIFFFTGTHDDYHGVGDHADKIEYERMARIAQLIFATAWQVANQDERPAVTGEGFN